MALSLLKQTLNNASGNIAPNCLLYGYFEINCIGDVNIQAPVLAADGQIFVVRTVCAHASNNIAFAFHSAYKGTFNYGPATPGTRFTYVFFFDDGEALLIHASLL